MNIKDYVVYFSLYQSMHGNGTMSSLTSLQST